MPPPHPPCEVFEAILMHGLFQLLIEQLRDRLFHAQGENVGDQPPPPFPYTRVNVGVTKHASPAAQRGSTPEGAAHKTDGRHPEKVRLKFTCLCEKEEGYWVGENVWRIMRWCRLQALRNLLAMSAPELNTSSLITQNGLDGFFHKALAHMIRKGIALLYPPHPWILVKLVHFGFISVLAQEICVQKGLVPLFHYSSIISSGCASRKSQHGNWFLKANPYESLRILWRVWFPASWTNYVVWKGGSSSLVPAGKTAPTLLLFAFSCQTHLGVERGPLCSR